jgi:hypothetical protein
VLAWASGHETAWFTSGWIQYGCIEREHMFLDFTELRFHFPVLEI